MHPHLSSQLAFERRRDMLPRAEPQRLARRLFAFRRTYKTPAGRAAKPRANRTALRLRTGPEP